MSEKLEVYDLNWKLLKVQNRKDFYSEIEEEYKNTQKITKKVKSIRLLLMNSSWRIYLQKRSNIKSKNAWLYDKSVWWHVVNNDSFNLTVVKECAEELWFPATVLSKNDFLKSLKVTDLNIIWVFREVDFIDDFLSIRINNDNSTIEQPFICPIYIWYYDWPIKFVDWESSWIEVFSLKELQKEIENNPNKFTEDIKFMVEKYRKYLIPIK